MSFVVGSNGFIGSHMKGIEAPGIICMAGISDTTCEDEMLLYQANVGLPQQLHTDACNAGLPFIYASSASVYGNDDAPLNAYARSKAWLDKIMSISPGQWYGLRFFNVYGPNEGHKGRQASIVHQMMGCESFALWPGERDFVYVDDLVSVARWLLETKPESGVYDVGTGVARPFTDIAKIMGVAVVPVALPSRLEGKYQHYTRADLTKLRAAGYAEPFLTLEDGIARMREGA